MPKFRLKKRVSPCQAKVPKQDTIPAFDPQTIRIQHITYYPSGSTYEGNEITEEVVSKVLSEIPRGIEVCLSLDPYGEDNFLEVICGAGWLALGCSSNGGQENYYSYNPAFAGTEELCPLTSGGQSPIEKYLAINDIEAGTAAAAYFIRTGRLYPCIDWAKQIG